MDRREHGDRRGVRGRRVRDGVLLVVLAAGVALTFWVWNQTRHADHRLAVERFDRLAATTARLSAARVRLVETALRSARGLILGSTEVEPDEWRRFAASLRDRQGPPGVRDLMWLEPGPGDTLRAVLHESAGPPPDVHETPSLLDAARRAIAHDGCALADPGPGRRSEDGVHLLLAVTDGPDVRGWVAGRLDPATVFGAALGDDAERLRLRVVSTDGSSGDPGAALYDSAPADDPPLDERFMASFPLSLADRTWSVALAARPAFETADERHLAVLGVGLALTLSLWGGLGAILIARDRAVRIADERARQLRATEGRYREVFLGGRRPQFMISPDDGKILDVNDAACRFYGFEAERMRRLRIHDLATGDDRDAADAILGDAEEAREARLRHRLASGLVRDLDVFASPIRVEDRSVLHVTLRDVTEQTETERTREITARVFEHASDAILVTDAHNRIQMVNPAFTRISGYEPEDARGRSLDMLEAGLNPQALLRRIQRSLAREGTWQGEIQCRRRNGEVHPGRLSISTLHGEDGRVTRRVVVFSDLSERGARGEPPRMVHVDALTRLPDRTLFQDVLRREIARAHREHVGAALVVLDLDGFRKVNDRLGHAAGDETLRRVAARLRDSLRASDTVARLGGDEFSVLAVDVDRTTAASAALRRMLDAVRTPLDIDGTNLELSVSAGVALFPDDGDAAEALLRHAESALSRAKDSGGDDLRYFSTESNRAARERAVLTGELLRALDRDEFELWWQPVWDLSASRISGTEALLRWRHPTRGLLEPDRFLPLAADGRLLAGIGSWVLRAACRQATDWSGRGLTGNLPLAINVSGGELREETLLAALERAVAETGLPAHTLAVEVPESVLVRQGPWLEPTLRRIHAAGVDVYVDGAGRADPTLSYLDTLRVDRLKVDPTPGTDAPTPDDAPLAIVAAAARRLGIPMCGGRIEDETALTRLRRHGGGLAQGFLLGRPTPAEEFERRLRGEGTVSDA